MTEHVVQVKKLSRRFGHTRALDDVSLQLESGCVYGLVGGNGQGKTTLIKHLLGLLRAQTGSVRVFGLDPVREPVRVLERIGYLSEDRELPEWMRVDELLRYTRAYHPNWDPDYAAELCESFQLDATKKIKHLSKGMRAQAGLIAAVAHRPDLLLLDEPSTGLDPIVRRDILNAIVRRVADDGRATLFSSHLLDEVEQMSDYIFLIDAGRLVLRGPLDDVKRQHHLLQVRFNERRDRFPAVPGLLAAERTGDSWRVTTTATAPDVQPELSGLGGEVTRARNASLQEIFVARVGRHATTTTPLNGTATGRPAGDGE